MASIAYQSPDGKVFYGQLDWHLLSMAGSPAASIREHAKQRTARHAAVAIATAEESVEFRGKPRMVRRLKAGFFTTPDDSKPVNGAHSLAAAFALWTAGHDHALLNVRTESGKHAVIVVINGLPVHDRLEADSMQAWESARPYLTDHPGISIYSDDDDKYPNALQRDNLLVDIAAHAGKATAIKAVPVDMAKVALLALVLAGMVGGVLYYQKWEKDKQRLARIAAAQAADPLPKYLKALAEERQHVGIQRGALKASFAFIQRLPLIPDGWRVTRVGCSVVGGCEVLLLRTTGTYASLRAALPFLELQPSSLMNLNEARLTWKQELPPERLDPATPLPSLTAFLQGVDASKLQTWLAAGLAVQMGAGALWPQTPGVPPNFRHPTALAAGRFEVNSTALPQLAEALMTAPPNVVWTGWAVDVGDVKQEPLTRAKALLTGNFYVSNH